MKTVSKYSRLMGVILIVALMLGAMSVHAQDERKVLISGVSMVGGDPETIDPGLTQASQENQINQEMFIGLTHQDEETGDVVPGIAESWDISEDGTVITYHLIQDIPWVRYNAETDAVEQVMDESGNPRYVTANDLVYGWQRNLSAELASPYAYVITPYVLNGVEYNAGEAAAEDLGVKAIDDYTFEVTMPEAVGFAPSIHGLWTADPMPQWAIEEGGDSWTEAEYINTYGPFALKEWAHDESVTLVKNPFWPGTDHVPQASIDEIQMRFLDPQAQFAEYQAGTIDAITIPLEALDQVNADATLSAEKSTGTQLCTYYVGYNIEKAPMDNVHLRRALSYAVDRQSIVDNVTKGGQIPARWFARPGLTAAPTLETNPDLGITLDVDMAQAELQLALDEMGLASAADLPAITLAYNDSSGHAAIMQAIQQMWTDNLGITAQLSAMDPTTYFSIMNEDATQSYRSGWCNDYPDANNFDNDVFHSGSTQNGTNYASDAFDALVDQARLETDTDVRRDLYVQAENLLVVEDAAIIPIYWYTTNQLTKPYVERTYAITGREAFEKWDIAAH
jgi:oligopeptide transport system substrate-binding protein